jgi:hypothetical protein
MRSLIVVAGVLAAAVSMIAIAKAWTVAMSLGPIAGPLAGLAITGLIGAAMMNAPTISLPSEGEFGGEEDEVDNVTEMKDGRISGLKIKTLPQDSIQIDKSTGDVAVGTNLNGAVETNRLLSTQNSKLDELMKLTKANRPLFRDPTIVFDSYKWSDKNASRGGSNANTKYKTGFA